MKTKLQNAKTFILQDLSILALLAVLFAGVMVVINTPPDMKLEFIIMLLITYFGILFAGFRVTLGSFVLAGLQIIVYTAFKIFLYYYYGDPIQIFHFFWIIYPLLAVGATNLFFVSNNKLETENIMLKDQVTQLVIIDPLTGLYNLKGLYLDLQRQIGLAERKGMDITLMIIALRYEAELKRVLGNDNLNILKQRLTTIVQDIIRLEDSLYAIDEKGTLALLLYCDMEGAAQVKRRIKEKLTSLEEIPEIIMNKLIRVDLQFGYLQYNADIYGRDIMGFKQSTESELQYDV